jgi:hypothetical protein
MASGSQYEEHMSYWIPARMCVVTSDVSSILAIVYIQGVSGGIVNILGGGSMDYSE